MDGPPTSTPGDVAETADHPPDALLAYVEAADPVSREGLAAQLSRQPGLDVVAEPEGAAIALVAVDQVDDEAARTIRRLLRTTCTHVAVVAAALDDLAILKAIEAGASAVVRRCDATSERLASVLRSAKEGHGTLPPDLLGSLLTQVGKLQRNVLQPRGLLFNGFTEREIEVLRLVADGLDTTEIAKRLSYSQRTVKNVLHDVTSRFNLKNRSHAVAYAIRAGVI